jgi:GT2 family glycosyltransferase
MHEVSERFDKMNSALPRVDIIIVNYNGLPFLEEFFKTLNNVNYPEDKVRVFFVDNNSKDGSTEFINRVRLRFDLQVIRNSTNYGFAKANNMIFPRCTSDYIALLNNDTRLDKEWLIELVRKMESNPDVGIADSKRMPTQAPRHIDPVTLETSWCSGGSCLIRRQALEDVGYFDEKFFMYGEDNDLSWRMWIHGWKCVYVPESVYEHHFGKPEKHTLRRIYFHVKNSILLRYIYGSSDNICKVYSRWIRDGLSLVFTKYQLKTAVPVFGALIGHIASIPHFVYRRYELKGRTSKWINL